ncbi:MAG: hypothetical protein VX100_06570 [Pseudomonadota bacterium]|nr:hypothetical protein [Pseudomonadota bacterium]
MNTQESHFDRINKSLIKAFNFIINHWLLLSAITTTTFTIYCYVRVIEYFRYYKINFLEYGSISDLVILVLRFDADINWVSIIMMAFVAVFIFSYMVQDWAHFHTEGNQLSASSKIKSGNTKIIYSLMALIMFCLIASIYYFTPKAIDDIPLESRKRVEVLFERAPALKCLTIIATTTDWIFFWQHEKQEPIIISKPKVLAIKTMVSRQPLVERIHKKPTRNQLPRKDILIDTNEEIKAHNKWVKELHDKCGGSLKDLRPLREYSKDIP